MGTVILVTSLLASLAQILQLLLDIYGELRQRKQNRLRIQFKVCHLRSLYECLEHNARELVQRLCRENAEIPANRQLVEEVGEVLEDCVQVGNDLVSLTVNGKVRNALCRINHALGQFKEGIKCGCRRLMLRAIGEFLPTLGNITCLLEEQYSPGGPTFVTVMIAALKAPLPGERKAPVPVDRLEPLPPVGWDERMYPRSGLTIAR